MKKLTPVEKAARKKEKKAKLKKAELAAMNNIRTRPPATSSKAHPVGTSKGNRIGRQRRYKNYQKKVWPGWRESDGIKAPVKVFRASEMNEQQQS